MDRRSRCTGGVCSAVFRVELKERELLACLEGKTVVTGRPGGVGPAGRLILVGTCTAPLRARGTYIEGYPPENSWIIDTLVD